MIAIFFSFVSWMFVSFYGAGNVVGAAEAAVTSGDSTVFVFAALTGVLGAWAGAVGGILLVTSLFAGILAFHNGINRYLHALASQESLPARLARTNKHQAPHAAGWVQSIIAVILIAPFVILGLDPVLTLFSWFSGLSVAALVTLYALCSIAIVAYALRHRAESSVAKMIVAPVLATVCLVGVLALIISNFTSLIGGEVLTAALLLAVVPIIFIIGLLSERRRNAKGSQE